MKIITFLTDFGLKDGYISQMKGVASAITDARLIDISHQISRHNIREGAFILWSSVDYFPSGTVHVAIVDPGVGTDRRGLIVTTRSQILIGPDNGLLMPAAHKLGDFVVYEISNKEYMFDLISNTFHGRDIFTPVASYITKGIPFESFGSRINNYVDLNFGQDLITNKSANGNIVYIDNFGNIVTNIDGNHLIDILKYDQNILVFYFNNMIEMPFIKSYDFIKKGNILATIGSSNLFEIAINQGNAAKKLKVKLGDEIKILFKKG
jgi:S-adenosylmethionine hydrolase